MNRSSLGILIGVFSIFAADLLLADVRLPAVFSDHMVLQQQQKIRVWGWADVGESV